MSAENKCNCGDFGEVTSYTKQYFSISATLQVFHWNYNFVILVKFPLHLVTGPVTLLQYTSTWSHLKNHLIRASKPFLQCLSLGFYAMIFMFCSSGDGNTAVKSQQKNYLNQCYITYTHLFRKEPVAVGVGKPGMWLKRLTVGGRSSRPIRLAMVKR